jgi:TetR/AcrR family transcriptional regulator
LADLSEFSVGTLYNFFKNKEEVYYTLILEKIDLLQAIVSEEVSRHPAGLSQIRALIEAYLNFYQENQWFFLTFIQEKSYLDMSLGASAGEELKKKYRTFIHFVAKVMAQAIQKEDIQSFDPIELGLFLVGMLKSFFFHWTLYPQKKDLISESHLVYDLFLNGAVKRKGNKLPKVTRRKQRSRNER